MFQTLKIWWKGEDRNKKRKEIEKRKRSYTALSNINLHKLSTKNERSGEEAGCGRPG